MGIILQIIFSLILVYILYRLLLKTKPKIYMNTEGKIAPIVAKMKTLIHHYI